MPEPFPGNPKQLQDMLDSLDNIEILLGSGSSGLAQLEDSIHVSGDSGIMMLGVRQDTQSNFGADGDYIPFSLDSTGALRIAGSITATIATGDLAISANQTTMITHLAAIKTAVEVVSAIGTVIDTVTTAGTRERLASAGCKRVTIQALASNTNVVTIGDVNVVSAVDSTQRGINLYATQSIVLNVNNTNLLYIDALVNGEGITYLYES